MPSARAAAPTSAHGAAQLLFVVAAHIADARNRALLAATLDSIGRHHPDAPVVVVDNASPPGCVAGLASNNRSSARGGAYVVDGGGEVLGPVGGVRRLLLAHHVARHRRDPRAARPARPAATRVTSQADLVRVGRLAGHSSGNLG